LPAISTPIKNKLQLLLSSETKTDLVTLFRKNPGLIDSIDGVARRVGLMPEMIKQDLEDLIDLGVLKAKVVGQFKVYSLDFERDETFQASIGRYVQSLDDR
jgi:predicted transcriptional regulator